MAFTQQVEYTVCEQLKGQWICTCSVWGFLSSHRYNHQHF